MCEKCFEKEIESFSSEDYFKQFEIVLEQKLQQTDGLFFFRQSSDSDLLNHTIYSCRSCSSKWYFQVPDGLVSGFFLHEKNGLALIEKVKNNDTKRRTIVVVICAIVMVICLIVLADLL